MIRIFDIVVCTLLRLLFGAFLLLPIRVRIGTVRLLLRFIELIQPGHTRVARRNLEIVFPNLSAEEREKILEESRHHLARAVADFARCPLITKEWVERHVKVCNPELLRELVASPEKRPIIILSGHVGSFELCGYILPLIGIPISFVARNFKLPLTDKFWNQRRCASGNSMIPRRGAIKGMLRELGANRHTGILIDQNMTRENAVFVDWFGLPAATTKAVALAAFRKRPRLVAVTISWVGDDQYELHLDECETADLYHAANPVNEELIQELTQRYSTIFQRHIMRQPASWFWMHRRWKTRPNPEDKSFYV